MSRARAFTFTFNNYGLLDEEAVQQLECQYLVYGREIAPETGTPHLQGYIYFKNPRYVKAVGAMFKQWHTEVAKADSKINRDYCTKSGDFYEKGDRPKTTKEASEIGAAAEKAKWSQIIKDAREGKLEESDPKIFFTHQRTAKALRTEFMQTLPVPTMDTTTGTFYIGPSGCGKSRTAREENPGAYIKNCNKWWDGYIDQEAVIMDDLDPPLAKALTHHIKIWLDHYPFTAEVKGGSLFIRPKRIIITSQYTLEQLFEDPEALAAIKRRSKLWIYNTELCSLELQ